MARKKGKVSSMSAGAKGKFARVMSEWKQGKLRSSSGEKVTSQDQALAIAFAEARKHDRG